MRYGMFLRWWLITCLVVLGSLIAHWFGLFGLIWEKDASYLSFATLALFYGTTAWIGYITLKLTRACKYGTPFPNLYREFQRHEQVAWFISEVCLNLGMLGTIVGFVMMLAGFENLNIAEVQSVQELLSQLGKSMATALYTTLIGLLCGQIIKAQTLNFGLELQKYEN